MSSARKMPNCNILILFNFNAHEYKIIGHFVLSDYMYYPISKSAMYEKLLMKEPPEVDDLQMKAVILRYTGVL